MYFIHFSDSESEDDTADTTDDRSPAQPPTNQQVQPKARASNWAPLDNTGASTESIGSDDRPGCSRNGAPPTQPAYGPKTTSTPTEQIRNKRKRCASMPSSVGQSSTANGFADTTPSSTSPSVGGGAGVIPPKRRRFPSISLPPTSAISQSNMSEQEANIRRKMLEDLEVFNTQIKQLAVIEKTKNRLLEKMLIISSALKNQGRASPTATSAANSQDNQ